MGTNYKEPFEEKFLIATCNHSSWTEELKFLVNTIFSHMTSDPFTTLT